MLKAGRQQQQLRCQTQHHYKPRPARQSRDCLLDTPAGSLWDPSMRGVFIAGDTRPTDNERTSSHGSEPQVTASLPLAVLAHKLVDY